MPSLKKNESLLSDRSSASSMRMPGLRKASSRSRLERISYWNSRVVRKISGSGLKVILVPVFFVSPTTVHLLGRFALGEAHLVDLARPAHLRLEPLRDGVDAHWRERRAGRRRLVRSPVPNFPPAWVGQHQLQGGDRYRWVGIDGRRGHPFPRPRQAEPSKWIVTLMAVAKPASAYGRRSYRPPRKPRGAARCSFVSPPHTCPGAFSGRPPGPRVFGFFEAS